MAAEAGVKPWEADHQTPAELQTCIAAHRNNQVHDMRQTRSIVYTIAAANRDPKKPLPKIEKFWPLPGDPGSEPKEKKSKKEVLAAHREKVKLYELSRAKKP